jgi:Ser/Thr protein kinase RdoA (MazF antagonist)
MERIMTAFHQLPQEEQIRRLERVAKSALAQYPFAPDATLSLINLSENATYRIDSAGERFAMRVHREGYHSERAIESELAWAMALRRDGAAVTPAPIPGRNGKLIQTVAHELMPRPRNVVAFRWEDGVEPSEKEHDLSSPFEILGEITARMHLHSMAWKRLPGFERHRWDFDTSIGNKPHWGSWRDGMGMTPERTALFDRTVGLIGIRLQKFGQEPERFGLIHCDMRLANLLIDGQVTKVIDFDDCGFSWLLYDCATTVSFFEHQPEVPRLIDCWVRGYRRVKELPAEDEQEIWTFVMLRRLLLVAWIGSHSETDLAKSMGDEYTASTVPLCEDYLSRFG